MKKKKTKKTGGSTCEHVVNHGEDVLHILRARNFQQQIHEELDVGLSMLWENGKKEKERVKSCPQEIESIKLLTLSSSESMT